MNDRSLTSNSALTRLALGCMGLSGAYGKTDDTQSIPVIHAAIERGVTFLDTGDFYGSGHNELLIGKAIAGRRDLVKAGYVRSIGLSEVGSETIRRAAKVHPIADLQIEYSIASRDPEDAIFPTLGELGICATLYGVLSRGLLSGSPIGAGDARAHMPRFSGANREANAKLVTGLQGLAKRWGITPSQLAIGWVQGKQPQFMPTLGMRTLQQLDEALAAKPLTAEQLAEVEAIAPRGAIAGTRYPAAHMTSLDSEKR